MFNPRLDYEIRYKCIYYHNTQTLWDSKSLDSRFLFVKERRDTPETGDKPSHTDMVISLKRELRARARAHRRRGITLYPGYVSGAPRGNKVYIHADWRRRLRCIDLPLGIETANSGRAICSSRWVNPSNELFDSDLSKRHLNGIDKMIVVVPTNGPLWKIATLSRYHVRISCDFSETKKMKNVSRIISE